MLSFAKYVCVSNMKYILVHKIKKNICICICTCMYVYSNSHFIDQRTKEKNYMGRIKRVISG